MAEPVRNDEPLSSMRFPQSATSAETSRPGPVPVGRSVDTVGTRTLPETTEPHAPIGEWPQDVDDRGPQSSEYLDRAAEAAENVRENLETAWQRTSDFLQARLHEAKRRFEVIRGRAQSGELQEDLRERASDLADTASRQARVARSRAEFYARNYPLQFIAGTAAAAFVVGFLLRMWRDE